MESLPGGCSAWCLQEVGTRCSATYSVVGRWHLLHSTRRPRQGSTAVALCPELWREVSKVARSRWAVAARLRGPSGEFVICSLYLPDSSKSLATLLEALAEIDSVLLSVGAHTIAEGNLLAAGDLNISFGRDSCSEGFVGKLLWRPETQHSPRTAAVISFLRSWKLPVLNTLEGVGCTSWTRRPWRRSSHPTQLDYVCGQPARCRGLRVLVEHCPTKVSSDHRPLTWSYKHGVAAPACTAAPRQVVEASREKFARKSWEVEEIVKARETHTGPLKQLFSESLEAGADPVKVLEKASELLKAAGDAVPQKAKRRSSHWSEVKRLKLQARSCTRPSDLARLRKAIRKERRRARRREFYEKVCSGRSTVWRSRVQEVSRIEDDDGVELASPAAFVQSLEQHFAARWSGPVPAATLLQEFYSVLLADLRDATAGPAPVLPIALLRRTRNRLGRRTGKAHDMFGVAPELLMLLEGEALEGMRCWMERYARSLEQAVPHRWDCSEVTFLVKELGASLSASGLRPISIIAILQKWFAATLLASVEEELRSRRLHALAKAFDTICWRTLSRALRRRIGSRRAWPILREIMQGKANLWWHGVYCGLVAQSRGGRQGSTELPKLWNMYLEEVLGDALASWDRRGFGIEVPRADAADLPAARGRLHHVNWADDLWLIAQTWEHMHTMLSDVVDALHRVGMSIAMSKLELLGIRAGQDPCFVDQVVHWRGVEVPIRDRMKVLGS